MIVVAMLLVYAGAFFIDVAEPGEYGIAAMGTPLIAGGLFLAFIAGRRSR